MQAADSLILRCFRKSESLEGRTALVQHISQHGSPHRAAAGAPTRRRGSMRKYSMSTTRLTITKIRPTNIR